MVKKNKKFWAHPTADVSVTSSIGAGTKIWNQSQVASGAVIGDKCVIGHNCLVCKGAKIGNEVKLESNIDVWDLVIIEDGVFVGPSVVFTNDPNPRARFPKSQFPQFGSWKKTLVKEGATIGDNATIICGVVIGRNSMVWAGAVVTKDIPDHALVMGVPAKVSGWICECGNKINFKSKKATCLICKKKYFKSSNIIVLV